MGTERLWWNGDYFYIKALTLTVFSFSFLRRNRPSRTSLPQLSCTHRGISPSPSRRSSETNIITIRTRIQNKYQGWGLVIIARGAKQVTEPSCAHNFHTRGVSELLSFLFYKMNNSINMYEHDFNLHIRLSTWKKHYISKSAEKNPGAYDRWTFLLGAQIES